MASTAIATLNSFLVIEFANATKRKGTIGSAYRIISLWETNKIEMKNIPTNQAISYSFIAL